MAEKLRMPNGMKTPSLSLLTRQLSNPASICRLIAESASPLTPSPEGSTQLRTILQRLELMEIESRDLLGKLFSMVQTDALLERYIRKRLADSKVSRIWELVEQILASQQGKLDIGKMLKDDNGLDNINGVTDYYGSDLYLMVKGLTVNDDGDGVRMDRFKIRHFDLGEVVLAHPYVQTGQN